jgi:hypothetical protein
VPIHPDSQIALPAAPAPDPAPPRLLPPSSGAASSGGVAGDPLHGVPRFTDARARYVVEPGGRYPNLKSVAPLLAPGDVVDVMGDATYPGGLRFDNDGTTDQRIVIRGVPRHGKLPVISGGDTTIEAAGDHYVFEGLEITGGAKRCFFHHADDVTLRLAKVHDCPQQGVLGADTDSGSMTLEYTEIYRSGSGTYNHQIYMATDETTFRGSTFRMQFCWVHDGAGGNNVKSRAERNEILYNWIEGAMYHEVELVGPDGQKPALAREDGQIVGNVIYKTNDFYALRLGGDGTGATAGRYRLLANTIVLGGERAAIRAFDSLESVELFENVFVRADGKPVSLISNDDAKWVGGSPVVTGARNWLTTGSVVPKSLVDTRFGALPGFKDLAGRDLRPVAGGSIASAPSGSTATDTAHPFPNAVARAELEPPMGGLGPARPRKTPRASLGAFDP